jgi:hypothetical protein
VRCPHCNEDFEPTINQKYCPLCGGQFDLTTLTPSEAEASAQEPVLETVGPRIGYCPWEDQDNLGFLQALIQTIKQSMLSPAEFFGKIPLSAGFLLPLLFALIVESVGSMAAYLWSMAAGGDVFSELNGRNPMLFALLIPLLLFMGIFIWSMLLHASLFLVGGAREDFEATFRIVCYTSGPELLGVIPIVGGIASIIWKVYITIVGIREVHGISNARAVIALVLPVLICCAIGLGGFIWVKVALGLH